MAPLKVDPRSAPPATASPLVIDSPFLFGIISEPYVPEKAVGRLVIFAKFGREALTCVSQAATFEAL